MESNLESFFSVNIWDSVRRYFQPHILYIAGEVEHFIMCTQAKGDGNYDRHGLDSA